jgi:alpha-ketoglutarate-dependent taurine dioxygenase
VKAGLPSGTFGQFAAGFVAGLGNTVGVTAADLRLGVPVTNAHRKAERAVAQNKKVVIFFKNPRALDDQAVADSVRSLERHTTRVVVLTDDVRNADHYGSLLEDLQVNQAPAIVVIGHSGKASLIEGYVDANSLVQVVADAR